MEQKEAILIESPAALAFKRFRKHFLAKLGTGIILAILIVAIFAPYLMPKDPFRMNLRAAKKSPSVEYLLGTDSTGRDVLSRLVSASRVSMMVGVGAVGIYLIIGVTIGSVAGYYGGVVDMLLSRLADAVLCFPSLIIVLVVVSIIGPSTANVVLAIGLLRWPQIMRIIRGEFLSLRERSFVRAAVSIGASPTRIITRHLLPNTIAPLSVAATFGVAQAILLEAGLSFLGAGVQPPNASWGNMLLEARSITVLSSMPWLWVPPGLMIVLAVLAINFVGDGLRDALDTRSVDD
jgi:ABC-type dipeptide/oligopeptide/nickel transport systems, permease components